MGCVTTSAGTVIEAKVLLITGGIGAFKPRPLPAADAFTGEGIVFFVPNSMSTPVTTW